MRPSHKRIHGIRALKRILYILVLLTLPVGALAQTASLHGQVLDESGAVVPKATVTVTGPSGLVKGTTAATDGSYSFAGLPPGDYTVQASAPKLEQQPVKVKLKPGSQTLRLELKVAAMVQRTTVQDTAGTALSTESSSNASALVLKGDDLKSLADDPEDLGTDLQALAGPSAGPGGSSIYVDGFSGGQLPSKDAIREIRINQNPFSPEYDKLGYGRVEIVTKPGADKFHGNGYYNFGDSVWNSRNPYAAQKAPFLLEEYGASLEGPLSKSASFFFIVDRAAIDNGSRQPTGPFGIGGSQGNTSSTGHRYNLTISLSMRNLLSHNNPGPIIGNIASPLFGRANQPYGIGILGGTGFSESANNRRFELQTRFTF